MSAEQQSKLSLDPAVTKPFIRFETKKLLFNSAMHIQLPELSYQCIISGVEHEKEEPLIRVSDGEYSIQCKLSTAATQAFYKTLALNQDITAIEGLMVVLHEPSLKFCMKKKLLGKESAKPDLVIQPVVYLSADHISIIANQKVIEKVPCGIKLIEEDQEIKTLIRFKVQQTQKDALNAQLKQNPSLHFEMPAINMISLAPPQPSSKTTVSSRYTVFEKPLERNDSKPLHVGFQDFTDEELDSEMLGSGSSSKQSACLTFKQVMAEFDKRINQKHAEDADFLQLLQMNNQEEEDDNEADEEELREAMDDDEEMKETEPKQASLRYDVNIGFGMNVTQNQNDLREYRHARYARTLPEPSKPTNIPTTLGSHPSQGDLLDMIDTSTTKKIISPTRVESDSQAQETEVRNQRALMKNSMQTNSASQPERMEDNNVNDDSPPNQDHIDFRKEIPFSRNDYESWITNMNERKFNHYMAWFNVNIKQVNTPPEPPVQIREQHDYRIQVPIIPEPAENRGILDRLKQTAHRRSNQAAPSSVAVVQEQPVLPEVIKIPRSGLAQVVPRKVESSSRVIPPMPTIGESAFNKKRNRQEFEGAGDKEEQPATDQTLNARGYKKIKANDGNEREGQRQYFK